MDINIKKTKNHAIIELHGSLIGTTYSQNLKNEIDILLEINLNKIILDMKHITFMDSSGIGIIIKTFKNVKSDKGQLFIVNCNSSVQNVLKLTKLDHILQIYDSVEEAESFI